MNRFQQRIHNIRQRNRRRCIAEDTIHRIEEELSCEVTDEIERALWDIKEAMDIPTEEIERAVSSRRRVKGAQNGRSI